MSNVLENIQNIKAKLESIKPKFADYIADKSISLEERWAVFTLAEMSLKNHVCFGPSLSSLPSNFVMYEGPVHMDRGETKTTCELIDDILQIREDIEDDMCMLSDSAMRSVQELDLNSVKEEILQKNCGSFDYDW